MAVPHHAVAAVGQLQVLPLGDEGVGFGNQHLRQHSPSAFTCDFGQWIIDRFRLTERDDGGISRHGVSLLSGGSGRLDTRLDTPPSIKRRHPDSRIALGRVPLASGSIPPTPSLDTPPVLFGSGQTERHLFVRQSDRFSDERGCQHVISPPGTVHGFVWSGT